jgi:citrate synthase
MGFPTDFFPVLFAIARTSGWLAHWHEQLKDPLPMFCAGQEYVGEKTREYVDLKDRDE